MFTLLVFKNVDMKYILANKAVQRTMGFKLFKA